MKPKTTRKFYVEWKSQYGWWRTVSEFKTLAEARHNARERNFRWKSMKRKQRIMEQITKIHKV